MNILALDFETTGLDVENDRVTEIGAVIYDTERNKPIRVFNELVWSDSYPQLTDEVIQINGITMQDLKRFAKKPEEVWPKLHAAIKQFPIVMAHNGFGFDFPILKAELTRVALDFPKFQAIDSGLDIPFPSHIFTRKLAHLAAEHGFANPFSHRAVFDVCTMLKIASGYEWGLLLERSKYPVVKVIARVSFQEKDRPKSQGFYWNRDKKEWVRYVRECDFQSLSFDFPTERKAVDVGEWGGNT